MRAVKAIILFLLFFSFSLIPVSAQNKTLSDKEILKTIKSKFGISEYPKPTLETNDTVVFILFRFGAWDRVAYNNTKAVAPLYIYVYSRSGKEVRVDYWTESKKLNGTLNGSWGFLGTIGKKGMRDTIYLKILIDGKEYFLKIPLVKSIKEKKEEKVLAFKKEVIVRHAQVAIVLAVFAIITAYVLKRKTLLTNPFNLINSSVVIGLTIALAYYLEYVRTDSTFWLAFVFTASEFLSYSLFSAGRRVWFMQILPSMRKIIIEEGILYKCREGLAFAIQSVDEAIKRWKGQHILIKDKEIGKIGSLSEDKMFKVIMNEIEWCDSILTVSAKIKREKYESEKED